MDFSLPEGSYDRLITESIRKALENLPASLKAEVSSIQSADLLDYLQRQAGVFITDHLRSLFAAENDPRRSEESLSGDSSGLLETANKLFLESLSGESVEANVLTSVHAALAKGPREPLIPFSRSALITNGSEPNYHSLLNSELETADQVDFICPFLGLQGVRLIADSLGQVKGRKRIITSTYLGASEAKAVDQLVGLGAEVRIIYESSAQKTALHAKSWIFYRNSGFTTATIGSSNLSHRALVAGLEWNVRLGSMDAPQIIEELKLVFNRLWEDACCQPYDPEADRQRLSKALAVQRGDSGAEGAFFLDQTPLPHQVEALEDIRLARLEGRQRNLVVAATGTGKTVLSAFDYKRQVGRPTFLYVAHRAEILQQSLAAYRQVLRDGSFGEINTGSEKAEDWRQVFCTIQSLANIDLAKVKKDQFHFIIVDEFHHAEASTYRRIFDHFQPNQWLGLTATPERMDGKNDILSTFWPPTFELRLWHALDRQLLCPFNYFGIDDGTDLSKVKWDSGKYSVLDLDEQYVNHGRERAKVVLRELDAKCDIAGIRAVAFCASIQHSAFMAEVFNSVGIESVALTSQTPKEDRAATIRAFRAGKIRILCTVDLFNEGIDIPEIDTVLFLRPTESATVFVQQLGRGLRLSEGKGVLTVLDFVGRQNEKFRMDLRFRALTGRSRTELQRATETGDFALPPGCTISLDKISRERVLASLKSAVPTNLKGFTDEYRRYVATNQRAPSLVEFLNFTGNELEDIYRRKGSFAAIRHAAEPTRQGLPNDVQLLGKLMNATDARRLESYEEALEGNLDADSPYLLMATSQIFQKKRSLAEVSEEFKAESRELLEILKVSKLPYRAVRDQLPFSLHAWYSRDEIVGPFRADPTSMREGTFFEKSLALDIHLITLVKSEKHFSPSTRYQDYFESPTIFHWESQSQTSAGSETGKRLVNPESRALLFVRKAKEDQGAVCPYLCIGIGGPISAEGEKPIQIRYRMEVPVPDHFFLAFTRDI